MMKTKTKTKCRFFHFEYDCSRSRNCFDKEEKQQFVNFIYVYSCARWCAWPYAHVVNRTQQSMTKMKPTTAAILCCWCCCRYQRRLAPWLEEMSVEYFHFKIARLTTLRSSSSICVFMNDFGVFVIVDDDLFVVRQPTPFTQSTEDWTNMPHCWCGRNFAASNSLNIPIRRFGISVRSSFSRSYYLSFVCTAVWRLMLTAFQRRRQCNLVIRILSQSHKAN